MTGGARSDPQPDEDPRRSSSTRAELVVGALGALLVLAALVFLGYQAVLVREDDAALRTAVTRVEVAPPSQHVVHFEVTNDGGVTAEAVRVVGELRRGGRTVEEVWATLPYVPVESRRSGALVFDEDPASGTLAVRATSYHRP